MTGNTLIRGWCFTLPAAAMITRLVGRYTALVVFVVAFLIRVAFIHLHPMIFGDSVLRLANRDRILLGYQLPLLQAAIYAISRLVAGAPEAAGMNATGIRWIAVWTDFVLGNQIEAQLAESATARGKLTRTLQPGQLRVLVYRLSD